jgi:hypothetical protein
MIVGVRLSALRETQWFEYAVRFLFGGLITAIAGAIAATYGPIVGGLFLAFPAIFPASATLVEKHESQRKQKHGLRGTQRGRQSAGVEAAGTAMGSIGLIAFGLTVWGLAPHVGAWLVLSGATVFWFLISVATWVIRKQM